MAFAERLTATAAAGGLTTHRNAAHWAPVFVLEGFVYDIPLHDLTISRQTVRSLEDRLAALGIALVLLTVASQHIAGQCVISTRQHRGPGWTAHLAALGATDQARAAHFHRAQDRLRQWAGASPLLRVEIDTSARRWDDYTRTIMHVIAAAQAGSVADTQAPRHRR